MAIQSFANSSTEDFFVVGEKTKAAGWQSISRIALRKLDILNYATKLTDLLAPPNNRLKALKGSSKGKHSIRINDQWRIVFVWTENGPKEVEIVDYHK